MNKAMIFIFIGVLLAGCTNQPGTSITHVYAFGDEQTDNGHCAKYIQEAIAQGKISPNDVDFFNEFIKIQEQYGGRMINGPVAVEVLAEQLNVPLTDYAVCMAFSGHDSLAGGVDSFPYPGLLGQVDQFEKDLNGKKADPEALYFIEIGMVDFFETPYPRTADEVVANIVTAVTRLAGLGAKYFMVGNSFNLGKFPGFLSIAKQAEMFQTKLNAALPGEMDKLAQDMGLEIEIFDITAAEERIQSNPDQYGFTQLVKPCTELGLEMYSGEICENPDEHYYWGYYYPTRVVHKILGEAMAEQLSK